MAQWALMKHKGLCFGNTCALVTMLLCDSLKCLDLFARMVMVLVYVNLVFRSRVCLGIMLLMVDFST
jgi:hypothetical protein